MTRGNRLGMTTFTMLVLGTVGLVACGDDGATGSSNSSAAGGQGAGGSGTSSGGQGGTILTGGNNQGGSGGEEACAQIEVATTIDEQPPDIIVVIGNNGSLSQEIEAVENNINQAFAQVLDASNVDYRVILVTRSGAHQFNMCVEAPLGGTPVGECSLQDNNNQPDLNPDKFFHYSAEIDSNDAWCKLLNGYDGTVPDEYGLAPNGWQEWLRPEAFKVLMVMSDSSTNCLYSGTDLDDGPQQPNESNIPEAEQSAVDFDNFLTGLSAAHFGTPEQRNYQFHSIVGLAQKDPLVPTDPWLPADDLSLVKCTGDTNPVSPALGYQALSRMTGGLRFPICEYDNFDVVFTQLAQNIVNSIEIACSFPLPDPPAGEELDPETVEMKFTPPGESEQVFNKVPGPEDCEADAFYIADDTILLCDQTCAKVQAAGDAATLDIAFGCALDDVK